MKVFFAFIVLLISGAAKAQILNPVSFQYSVVKKSNNTAEVRIKALIEPKWHLYSVKNPAGGAQPTEIAFKNINTVGAIKESGKMKTMYEKEFKTNQKYFENTVTFVQLVKLKPGTDKVTGTITYMVCNDRQCLPPKEVEFKIKI